MEIVINYYLLSWVSRRFAFLVFLVGGCGGGGGEGVEGWGVQVLALYVFLDLFAFAVFGALDLRSLSGASWGDHSNRSNPKP